MTAEPLTLADRSLPKGFPAAALQRGGRRPRRRFPGLVPYLFMAPFLALFLAVQIAPMVYALWLSLFRDRLIGGAVFVGLENYTDVLVDPKLWRGVGNVLAFGIVQVPVMLGLALVLALILDSALVRARSLFQVALYLPYAVPTVIAALIWGYLYGPTYGPFAQLAEAAGLEAPRFLSDRWMLLSLANIVTWEYTGYNMVILFSALQAIPRDLEEAAALDGAGPVAFAWHVKLPLVRPALRLCVIFSIIGTFQLFNEPRVMEALAPYVIGDHYTPNIYACSLAFTNIEHNRAAAVSFVIGAIVAAISYVFLAFSARIGERSR